MCNKDKEEDKVLLQTQENIHDPSLRKAKRKPTKLISELRPVK
jgi:hypothetical protein